MTTTSSPSARAGFVHRRLATFVLLLVLVISMLLSLPGLRAVPHRIGRAEPGWIAAGVGLEILSSVSFVVLFRLFFDRLAARDARRLAWTEMATGALLPGGGTGGLALGGWLIHMAGAPLGWIVRRSGGVFFLTSFVNGLAVIGAGVALLAGAAGPHGFMLDGLPVLLAAVAIIPFAVLPFAVRARATSPRVVEAVAQGVGEAARTAFNRRPNWRLIGALGWLGFDIAVLWVTLRALGPSPSVPALVLAYNMGYLANALPIPGGVGVLDAGLTGALVLYGVAPMHAAAAVLLYHAIALWVPGIGGLYSFLRLRPQLLASAGKRVEAKAAREATLLGRLADGAGTGPPASTGEGPWGRELAGAAR